MLSKRLCILHFLAPLPISHSEWLHYARDDTLVLLRRSLCGDGEDIIIIKFIIIFIIQVSHFELLSLLNLDVSFVTRHSPFTYFV